MRSYLMIGIKFRRYLLLLIAGSIFACSASLPSQSQSLSETARSANSFIESVGVVTHLSRNNSAYGDYDTIIRPRLQELGIRHIRDGVKLKDAATRRKLIDLATLGIKSTLVMDPRDQEKAADAVDIVKAMPTSVEAVEGPNEWDVWGNLTYRNQAFPEGVRIFQSELYNAIKRNSATADLKVLSPTVAFWSNARKLGAVKCDYGAMHSYAGGKPPTTDLSQHWIPSIESICPDEPVIATEAGWHNAVSSRSGQPGVSEAAAGKYIPRLCLEYFNQGIKRVYINELINKWQNSKKEGNFGLLHRDGSPKPAFTALKNLISILQDSEGEFSPSTLSYSIEGTHKNVHHTLLQKHDRSFYLVLWQEVSSFDLRDKQDIAVSPQAVTLKLNTAIRQGRLYHLLPSINPVAQYTRPTSIALKISDEPLIVELFPA